MAHQGESHRLSDYILIKQMLFLVSTYSLSQIPESGGEAGVLKSQCPESLQGFFVTVCLRRDIGTMIVKTRKPLQTSQPGSKVSSLPHLNACDGQQRSRHPGVVGNAPD